MGSHCLLDHATALTEEPAPTRHFLLRPKSALTLGALPSLSFLSPRPRAFILLGICPWWLACPLDLVAVHQTKELPNAVILHALKDLQCKDGQAALSQWLSTPAPTWKMPKLGFFQKGMGRSHRFTSIATDQ